MGLVVLIPESTRKERVGDPRQATVDGFASALPPPDRRELAAMREEILARAKSGPLLPAYLRFRGNMYRHIPRTAWEDRQEDVEVLIVSAVYGVLASRDTAIYYERSMAERTPPYGKMNRWWHDRGVPKILAAYLKAVRPKTVVDLLSLEYREAVEGYADGLSGMAVKPIDFPGMGRASQTMRGEKVAAILKAGSV